MSKKFKIGDKVRVTSLMKPDELFTNIKIGDICTVSDLSKTDEDTVYTLFNKSIYNFSEANTTGYPMSITQLELVQDNDEFKESVQLMWDIFTQCKEVGFSKKQSFDIVLKLIEVSGGAK